MSDCARQGKFPLGGVGGRKQFCGMRLPAADWILVSKVPAPSLPGTTRTLSTRFENESPSVRLNGAMPPVMWQATHLLLQIGWMDCS